MKYRTRGGVEERYICPYCNGWETTARFMPDSQGEFWLVCDDCNKVSDLPDREIIAELEYLQIQIQNELKILTGRRDLREYDPAKTAKRGRKGPAP